MENYVNSLGETRVAQARYLSRQMAALDPSTQSPDPALVLDRLRVFVIRRVEPSAAHDVLQDIWIRPQRGAVNVRDRERFTGWMYRVARSAIADHREEQRKHVPAPSGVNAGATAEPDDYALVLACARSVRGVVEQLPAKYRDVLMLTELEQLSYADVGARLGLSLAAVKSRVLRGGSNCAKPSSVAAA